MTMVLAGRLAVLMATLFGQVAGNDSGNDTDDTPRPSPVLSLTFDQAAEALKDLVVGKVNLKSEGPRPPQFPKLPVGNLAAEFKGGAGAGRLVVKDAGDNSPLDFKLGDTITIEAWVAPVTLGNGQAMYVVGKGRTGNDGFAKDNQNWALRLAGSKAGAAISFLFRGSPVEPGAKAEFHRWDSSTGFAVDGSWHHVAVTYTFGDPNSIRGVIDGEAVKGTWAGYGGPTTLGPVVDNDEVWVGASMGGGSSSAFQGGIDELVVYRGPVPMQELLDRYERVRPPSYVTPGPLPAGKVLVELFYGIADKPTWDFSIPLPVESFTQDHWTMVEVPAAYSARGIRENRATPMMLRMSGLVTFGKGPQRVLIRSRSGARLFIDDVLVTENRFAEDRSDGHNDVYVIGSRISEKIRAPRPGDRESAVVFEGTGSPQKVTFEAYAGGKKRRPEFGELCVAIERSAGEFEVLSYTDAIPLTDESWRAFAWRERDRNREVNQERRARASSKENEYWSKRHAEARDFVTRQPAVAVPPAPAGRSPIDAFLDDALAKAGASPQPVIDDWAFLRRASLDVIGRIPTPSEITAFHADPPSERRGRLIERLLASPEWADHWTAYWQDVLAENPNIVNPTLNNTGPFRWWIYESFLDNKPFDRFVTELVLMEGSERYGGAAGFAVASQNDAPNAAKAGILAQALLGMNMKCARCHDAPYHDFDQRDLFELAALIKRDTEKLPKTSTVPVVEGARKPLVEITLKPGEEIKPSWPFADKLPGSYPASWVRNEKDTREQLAAWLTTPSNERFAEVIVNRLWHRYMGRGIVEPIDDWEHPEPTHPELLKWLARELVASGYDLKHMAWLILTSEAYQRQSETDSSRAKLFAGPAPRRMTAEQIVDSLFSAAGKPFNTEELSVDLDGGRNQDTSISLGLPRRAWQFTSLSNERDRPSLSLPAAQTVTDVLEAFGWRPSRQESLTVRPQDSSPLQPALLENGVVGRRIAGLSDDSRFTQAALDSSSEGEFVDRLFETILTRKPTAEERKLFADVLAEGYASRVVPGAPVRIPGPPREMGVTWSNHLKPEANEFKMQIAREVEQGDPPTARLVADWRERAEDVVWTIVNSPEFVFVP
jgi:hypothetical protein